ncbi:aldehyde dehydrogenase [Nocardioides humi]|uniref:Aldehyde dehydrogenase n=1 Tax=Nocardioides humi TaxID=449461 RepID=A0ABN2BIN1_9ACTN|nr:aldehyde dehydrogenase [Nocardioides humi]
MTEQQELWIGGRWATGAGVTTTVVNPAGLEPIATARLATTVDVDHAVAQARASFDAGVWSGAAPAERAQVLRAAADLLEKRQDELARTLTGELGCPLWFSERAHVPNPIRHLRTFADLAQAHTFDEEVSDGANRSLVIDEPVGVVGAITPWNGPLSSPAIKVGPALAAGCSVVLKPSVEAPLTVMALGDALAEAGLPEGVLSILPGGTEAGVRLVEHPDVDKIAFTGSTATGRQIMRTCADRIARITLELGGKSAAVVLPDADVEKMVAAIMPMSLVVTGQLCISQSRVLVPRSLEAEVTEALAAAMAALRVGDPLDPATFLGPLVSSAQRDRVEGYVDLARTEGATVATGGRRPDDVPPGYFVEPTLLTGVTNAMRVAQEEIFGPVIAVVAYDSVEEAIAIANDSPYGLSGSVWSADPDAALAVARRIRTGMVSINGAPQAWGTPFGGYKQSGIGREMGMEGLRAYFEKKSVALGPAVG